VRGLKIKSPYEPFTDEWHIQWPGQLSQHDIVYHSPPEDPVQGLPVGNGDMGALLWTEGSRLVMAINKCDIWDDSEEGDFAGWGKQEEGYRTSLRHCGRLRVDFSVPAFDLLYQQDFEARLDLAGGSANVSARTPFSKVNLVSYCSHPHRVIVVRCDLETTEDVTVKAILERWGSRTFAHWYSQINRDPSIGLEGTETGVMDNTVLISQKLRSLDFVLGARIVADGAEVSRLHSRAGEFELTSGKRISFDIYLTAVTSENAADPERQVTEILKQAVADGQERIREEHEQDWKRFWEASFVWLPDNYLENIWYLVLYFANSSFRGRYPPHFCNRLWGFTRDFVPWNYYFHWNMQNGIWPFHPANHGELAQPYYRYRRNQLPVAKESARNVKGKDGAFYADVADRRGYNDLTTGDNNTPGAQIAMDFWMHYQYTDDEEFLRDQAWPVMKEVARFYADLVVKEHDGRYHIRSTQAYEGSPLFDDTVTDLAMIKALFPVAIEAAQLTGFEGTEVEKWKEIANNTVDFQLVPLEADEYTISEDGEMVLTGGLGKGKPVQSGKVFAAGRHEGKWVRNRYGNKERDSYYGIPDPELAPVFPAGVIGLADRGSELFRAAVDQVRLHPRTIPDKEASGDMTGSKDLCMGWCPYPIVLARLGLSEELVTALRESISTWQFYCQGFGHYGPYHVFTRDASLRWNTNLVRATDNDETFPFPSWPFRHFSSEPMSIVCAAVNEMLVQSHDGVIRLCPAVPPSWNIRFRLAATGGFIVNTEHVDGKISWVSIRSNFGKVCRVVRPWNQEHVYCVQVGKQGRVTDVDLEVRQVKDDSVLEFATSKGGLYLLAREENILDAWETETVRFCRNSKHKTLGDAQLGLPRMF